jgi:hypothetical protein
VNLVDLPLQYVSLPSSNPSNQSFKPLLRGGLGLGGRGLDSAYPVSTSTVAFSGETGAAVRAFVAQSDDDFAHADRLVAERYAWRGYQLSSIDPLKRAAQGLGGPYLSLLCEAQGSVVGTVTLGLDSEEGLYADQLYREEIDALRKQGSKLCELVRFAVVGGVEYRAVLDALFGLAYHLARALHSWTDLVIEVNPRHAKFYRRLLGFTQLGDEKLCPRVGAPSVLLSLSAGQLSTILSVRAS